MRKFLRQLRRVTALTVGTILLMGLLPAGAVRTAAAGKEIYIGSVSDLEELSEKCVQDTWSKGVTVRLNADLNLRNSWFESIPLFDGRFEGQGHTISGYEIIRSGSKQGLFRQILENGVVCDLTVEGSVTPDGSQVDVGGIAGINYGTIENCTFRGTVTGLRSVGGIAGSNGENGKIIRCNSSGSVSGEHRTGGIVGESEGLVENCTNAMSVNTTYQGSVLTKDVDDTLNASELLSMTDAGGVVGYSSGVVRGCENEGDVGYNHVGYNIGGVVGRQSGKIENSVNYGKVLGRRDVGGILGQMDPEIGWNLSGGSLGVLQSDLDNLQEALDQSIEHLSNMGEAGGDVAQIAVDNIKEAGSVIGEMTSSVTGWANANLTAVNQLSDTVTQIVQGLAPIAKDLSEFSDKLAGASEVLSEALKSVESEEQQEAISETLDAVNSLAKESSDVSGEMDKAMRDLEESNCISVVVDAWNILTSLPKSISDMIASINSALMLVDKINRAGATGKIGDALEELGDSLDALTAAGTKISELAEKLGNEEAVQFATLDVGEDEINRLLNSLNTVTGSVMGLEEYLQVSMGDVQNLTDKVAAMVDTLLSMLDVNAGSRDGVVYTEDISALEDENRTSGLVRGCVNYGSVTANNNVGGVTGAITLDLNFDEDSDWNLSALISQGARYLIYAAIYNSASYAPVRADKSTAGGITGRMDYGAVLYCEVSGDITSEGEYVGGIAGYSTGTLFGCAARTNLNGDSYVGGIAGLGGNVARCFAMPHIIGFREFGGSIVGSNDSAGSAETLSISYLANLLGYNYGAVSTNKQIGVLQENYYAQSTLGGSDGFSFAGQCEEVTYEKLLELSEQKKLFRSINVIFVKDGHTVANVEVPFGGSITELPTVEDEDGKYWVWDSFQQENIYYSITVNGSYHAPTPSLSTAEDSPLFIVEGEFYTGQTLLAVPYHEDLSNLTKSCEQTSAYTLTVSDTTQPLTVRMQTEEKVVLYTSDGKGDWKRTSYQRDGKYIVFPLENGGTVATFVATLPTRILTYAILGVLILAAALLLWLFVRRRKAKRRKAQKEDTLNATPNTKPEKK